MTIEVLSPAVRASTEILRQEFAAAQPFGHIVIDNFIEPAFCDRLIAEFPPFRDNNAVNELGEVGRKAVIPNIARISAAYAAVDRLMRSKDFLHWLGEVTSVPNLRYDPEYIGGGTHENLSGQDLDWHVDFNYHPHRPLPRRLNLILFLNREWQPEWGGSLELHRDPWNPGANACIRSIVPVANRCVVFETTEASWHGFSRIHAREDGGSRSRRSIAVYFYTKERPTAETATPHGRFTCPGHYRGTSKQDIRFNQKMHRNSRASSRAATGRFSTYTSGRWRLRKRWLAFTAHLHSASAGR